MFMQICLPEQGPQQICLDYETNNYSRICHPSTAKDIEVKHSIWIVMVIQSI